MSALMRFLAKDAAAKTVVLATLSLTPAMAGQDQAAGPDAQAILVALQGEAANLGKVVTLLRDSTDRCLSAQAAMLQGIGGDAAGARSAVSTRRADARQAAETDTSLRDSQRLLSSGHLMAADRDDLLRHVRLRNACLTWAERSVGTLSALTAEGPRAEERLAAARSMAERDMERLIGLGAVADGDGLDGIRAMETSTPRM